MVRGGHTQGGSRNNTPLALLTGHFHSNTHNISARGETTSQTTRIPFSFPLRPISPPLPSPPHFAFPYLTHTPHSPHNPLSARQRTLHHFSQSQLEAPVSSNHQEPGRLQEGKRERGRRGKGGSFAAIVCSFYHKLESISQLFHIPPHCHKPPLTSCSVPAPPWSTHSAALITNCRLPSVGEADHLLQEKANTPLSTARCTHNWSSTVRLYKGRTGRASGRGLVMQ